MWKNKTIHQANVGLNIQHKRTLLYCLMVLQYIHSKLSSDEDDEQQYNKLKPIK